MIDVFLATTGAALAEASGVGVGDADGVGLGATATFSWVNFTFTTGAEKLKPLAERYNQPSLSFTVVTATCFSPFSETTSTVAFIGAFEKP